MMVDNSIPENSTTVVYFIAQVFPTNVTANLTFSMTKRFVEITCKELNLTVEQDDGRF